MILQKIVSFWINTVTPQMNLSELEDKLISLRVHTPNLEQSLYFHGQRIELERMPMREPDLIITGDLYTIVQFLGGNDRAKVTIEGHLPLAVTLQQCIQTSDIDWQEWLNQATGQFIPEAVFNFNPCNNDDSYQALYDRIQQLEERIHQLEKNQSS